MSCMIYTMTCVARMISLPHGCLRWHGMPLMSVVSGAIFCVATGMIHSAMPGVVILILFRMSGLVVHMVLFVLVHSTSQIQAAGLALAIS